MSLRIVLADDSLIVREGVRRMLDSQPDLKVVDACADLGSLMTMVGQLAPDVVVTDVRMPPTNTDEGIRAAAALRASHPGLAVVVLSQYADPEYALKLFEHGSGGRAYLVKDAVGEPGQLAGAVRAVAAGGSVVDPAVVEALVAVRAAPRTSPLAALTERERDVLAQIAQGKSNAAAGAALYLSERAVEKHINTLFAKLGLTAEPDTNRRVKAVLIYLAAQRG
ncbi:response regulator transcription factor [Frankia sp. AgB1.9]|uniref:response regulator transcription factor n=1 Tax=unclassified Frankia TaxID=2632575 RepID=UPI00193388A1|nr:MULTISPECIES: response regulator transcription factor [unclassified Frankia]MBL7490445.1 response regulator transcription factor [Frankia sp. AgW1.1]MBL7548227.1 response regulator transcription factor [Frankia sp. AgB1.9]MBL7621691.1 response regulator transcription factor [Frankia sp. AgB1.8]